MIGIPIARISAGIRLIGATSVRRYAGSVYPMRIFSRTQMAEGDAGRGRASSPFAMGVLLVVPDLFTALAEVPQPHEERRPERQDDRYGRQRRLRQRGVRRCLQPGVEPE